MKSSLLCLLIAAACLYASSSQAAARKMPNLHFGQPQALAGSNGCNPNNFNATVTPDGATLTVIFDEMMAQAGDGTGKVKDLKRCRLRIPVQLPEGYQIIQTRQDFRGSFSLPRGAAATLDVTERFQHRTGAPGRVYRRFVGPVDYRDYTVTAYPLTDATSPCGGKTYLDMSSDLTVTVPKKTTALAFATLDTIDTVGHYSLQYRLGKCKK
jgi:hypothetical protein